MLRIYYTYIAILSHFSFSNPSYFLNVKSYLKLKLGWFFIILKHHVLKRDQNRNIKLSNAVLNFFIFYKIIKHVPASNLLVTRIIFNEIIDSHSRCSSVGALIILVIQLDSAGSWTRLCISCVMRRFIKPRDNQTDGWGPG